MKNITQRGMTAVGVTVIIVILIILAIIVIAATNDTGNNDVMNNTNNSGMTGTNNNQPETIAFRLNEQNDSGQSGLATFTEENGRAKVVLSLTGSSSAVAQPAHIHMNSCANIGSVVYPLTNVVNGTSETVLNVPISQIFASLPLSINVHKSAAEQNVYVACGDISATSSVR